MVWVRPRDCGSVGVVLRHADELMLSRAILYCSLAE